MAPRRQPSDAVATAAPNQHAGATETSPLLASSSSSSSPAVTRAVDQNAPTTTATSSSSSSAPHHRAAEKPLPVVQILFLCYARLVEPVAFFSIFPYVNQMVKENGHLDEADMGFYSGLIESLFSLTQMIVMVAWGRAADRIGRKPVLVSSLIGVAIATSFFGMATTIWQMILFRCAAGVFAGTVVTIRTMFSEHSTPQTQARAFSWFAVSGNLGIFIGPLLGGALADPAGQYPALFGGIAFFEKHPYALSCFVVGFLALTAVLTTAFFVEETLPRKTKTDSENGSGSGNGSGNDSDLIHPLPPTSTWALLHAPGVGVVLYNYGHVMVLAFAYTAVMPVFWATEVRLGGFGLNPLQLSLFMAVSGLAQTLWLLLAFPPLQHRIGTNGVMRVCGIAYPFVFLVMPPLSAIPRYLPGGDTPAFWVLASLLISLGTGVSMSFTAVQLALNDVSPSPETLGMLNALALTLLSGLRAFSPALFASLFAVGVGHQIMYGYFVWFVMAVLALGFTFSARFMPAVSEKVPADEEDE
ncbi:MFS general substrate transporter [Xylaria sp. CBS 124048]|nr:MFS general substrate transporter [Xylaria sp. CBS 124048]